MPEYIDKQKLKSHYAWWNNEEQRDFDAIIDAQLIADVAEVRHGKWMWNGETCCNQCSVCGVGAMWFRVQMEYYYCPNCGAKMDESEDEDNV